MKKVSQRYYFAYGSNLSSLKMNKWSMNVEFVTTARLDNWQFAMNKKGKDGCCRANIEEKDDEHVWGVIYRIPEYKIEKLDEYEGLGKGYRADWLNVLGKNGESINAYVYIGKKLKNNLPVHKWYSDFIISGAREHKLPLEYVFKLENILDKLDVKKVG